MEEIQNKKFITGIVILAIIIVSINVFVVFFS